MCRALMLTAVVAVLSAAASGQTPGVLHVRVTLADAAGAIIPVPEHALLISDNPATGTPRRVVTGANGTADVRLRPGNYTVESDEPFVFNGKGYQWRKTLDIPGGRDVALEFTAANADVGAAPATSSPALSSTSRNGSEPALLLAKWKDSVVAVWTPESRASGALVDAAGFVVTAARAIRGTPAVDVQISDSIKVAARVLVADHARDVAVLWIDPATAASVHPLPLGCANASKPSFADGQKLVAIGAPLRGDRELSRGDVVRLEPPAAVANVRLAPGSVGGPVFNAAGDVIGLSSAVDDADERRRRDARVVPLADLCEVVSSAQQAMQTMVRPVATRVPVEPQPPPVVSALEAEMQRRFGNLSPPRMSSSDFDIAFLTPVMVYAAQHNTRQTDARAPVGFGEWSEYFAGAPRVLVVRVTPRMTESFWTTVARGAAYTQGAALPPITHFKPGFSRLRALCGDVEVTPIHPFVVTQRVSDTDAIREGLYVFEPDALGPHCGSVKLVVSSEKAPEKEETRVVDPKIIERMSKDFAS